MTEEEKKKTVFIELVKKKSYSKNSNCIVILYKRKQKRSLENRSTLVPSAAEQNPNTKSQ